MRNLNECAQAGSSQLGNYCEKDYAVVWLRPTSSLYIVLVVVVVVVVVVARSDVIQSCFFFFVSFLIISDWELK